MALVEIKSAEKLLRLSPKDFKEFSGECRKGKQWVVRMLIIKRNEVTAFEKKKYLKPKERKLYQDLCARVIELGQNESGYDLQQKELEEAIRTWSN